MFCFYLHTHAQSERYLEYGGGVGAAIYQGDISPYALGTIKRPGLSVQLLGNLNLSSALSVRLNYAFAFLSESDKNYGYDYKPHRNFSFETKVNEFSIHFVFNPLSNNGYEEYHSLVPYMFTGVGIGFLNVSRDWSQFEHGWKYWQKWVAPGLAEDSMHVPPKYVLTLPVGLGLKYQLEDNISIFGEISKRFTQEEYLDGFSKAANQKKRDGFSTVTVGVIFRRSSDYTSRRIRYY